MDYKEYYKQWMERHKGEYEIDSRNRWINVAWQSVLVFVILIASSFVSMVHSVPAIYSTVDIDKLAAILPGIEQHTALFAALAFIAFEVCLFVIEFLAAKTDYRKAQDVNISRLMRFMVIITLAVLLTSNVTSGLRAIPDLVIEEKVVDWLDNIVAFLTGIVAPTNALLSGRILAFIFMEAYLHRVNTMAEINKRVNTAYTRHVNKGKQSVQEVNKSVQQPLHLQIRHTINENPEQFSGLTQRKLADYFNTSVTTINKALNPDKYPD